MSHQEIITRTHYLQSIIYILIPEIKENKPVKNHDEYTYLNYVTQESFSCLNNKVIESETRKDKKIGENNELCKEWVAKQKNDRD